MKQKGTSDAKSILSAKAQPKTSNKKERSIFFGFKKFFLPRLQKQEELGLAYQEAKVKKLDAEGEKLIQEAAKIAAEKDLIRQQKLKEFCANVDGLIEPNSPSSLNMIKLAALLESYPEIAMQLERVQELIDKLYSEKSCIVDFQEDEK